MRFSSPPSRSSNNKGGNGRDHGDDYGGGGYNEEVGGNNLSFPAPPPAPTYSGHIRPRTFPETRRRVVRPNSPTALEDDEIEMYDNLDMEGGVIIRILSDGGSDSDEGDDEEDVAGVDLVPPPASNVMPSGRDGGDDVGGSNSNDHITDIESMYRDLGIFREQRQAESNPRLTAKSSANEASSHPVSLNDNDNVVTVLQDDGTEEGIDVQLAPQPSERSRSVSSSQSNADDRSCISYYIEFIKYTFSLMLLTFSLFIIVALIFSEQTLASSTQNGGHPIMAVALLLFLLLWLAMMEGGQGCIVGLQPIDENLYKHTHRISWTSTSIAHKGNNIQRFIIGRQCLVVIVVFAINICCNKKNMDSNGNDNVFDRTTDAGGDDDEYTYIPFNELFPTWIMKLFVNSGIAMILLTTVVGQLTSQINAAYCMLDFINTNFMVFTTYVSLAIEFSGLLHCVYLVQMLFNCGSTSSSSRGARGNGTNKNQPQHQDSSTEAELEELRNMAQPRNKKAARSSSASLSHPTNDLTTKPSDVRLLFWSRVIFSLFVVAISLSVTLKALFTSQTAMNEDVPPYISTILFFGLLCLVGLLEGTQIALFAVKNDIEEDELQQHTIARMNCQLAFDEDSRGNTNLQSILIGRQILVTICMFIVAKLTTITVDVDDNVNDNLFHVYDRVQQFFNTGLLGAIITTIIGSLVWRIVASSFPIAFLSNPVIYLLLRLCLLVEASGVCSAAWILAYIHKNVFDLKEDEVYIGTKEERRAHQYACAANAIVPTALASSLAAPTPPNDDPDDEGDAPGVATSKNIHRNLMGNKDKRIEDPMMNLDNSTTGHRYYRGFDIDKSLQRIMEENTDVVSVDHDVAQSEGNKNFTEEQVANEDGEVKQRNQDVQEEFETQLMTPSSTSIYTGMTLSSPSNYTGRSSSQDLTPSLTPKSSSPSTSNLTSSSPSSSNLYTPSSTASSSYTGRSYSM